MFTRTKLAVFVDGCFWHQCPVHGTMPKSNVDYWEPKLQANVARDRRVDELLREHGWAVLRLWEHDDACRAADRVVEAIRRFDVGAMDRGSVPSAADEEPGNIGSAEH